MGAPAWSAEPETGTKLHVGQSESERGAGRQKGMDRTTREEGKKKNKNRKKNRKKKCHGKAEMFRIWANNIIFFIYMFLLFSFLLT